MQHVKKQNDMSYSMVVDKQPPAEQSKPFQKIEPRHIYTWVKDEAVTNCYECKQPFSTLVRKHHCRICGRIFCYKCSSTMVHIPPYLKSIFPIPKGKNDTTISTIVKDGISMFNPLNLISSGSGSGKHEIKNNKANDTTNKNNKRTSKQLRRSQDLSHGKSSTTFLTSTPIIINNSYKPIENRVPMENYHTSQPMNIKAKNNYSEFDEKYGNNATSGVVIGVATGVSPNSSQLFGQYLDTLLDNNEEQSMDTQDSEPDNDIYVNSQKKVRTCAPCHGKLKRLCDLEKQIRVFNLMDLDILFLKKIGLVCKPWNQLSIYYLSRFREIQYYLYDHKYLELDKKLLWINKEYLYGHSIWLLQLIRSVNYRSYSDRTYKLPVIEKIVESWSKTKKYISCWQLMCTRHCHDDLRPEDCVSLLDENIRSDIIRNFALQHLGRASETELRCYLPTLVHYIRYETVEQSFITTFLMKKSNDNHEIANDFYWLLKVSIESKTPVYKSVYEYQIDKFRRTIKQEILVNISKGEHLVNVLSPMAVETKAITMIQNLLVRHINENTIGKFACPTRPDLKYTGMAYGRVCKFKSATAPLLLPFTYKDNSQQPSDFVEKKSRQHNNRGTQRPSQVSSVTPLGSFPPNNNNNNNGINNNIYNYQILYKPEDVRKDMIIMNIIKLMDIILKKEGLDLHIITYDVKAISKNRGIIEMVPDSTTMYYIRENMQFSILNYIIEKNPTENIDTLRRRFMYSCSAYCVITYLLGIGDRHLDNIMITNDGYMFHVDYGFVLGFDPKPMAMPQMRITDDMIDVLGGPNSACYHEFKELCNKIYNILRGHVSIFLNLLTLLVEMDPPIDNKVPFTKKSLKKEVMDRFIPGETYQEANLQLISHIENNSTYGQYVNDFFHYHAKENTLKKTLTTTVQGTKNIFSTLYGFFK